MNEKVQQFSDDMFANNSLGNIALGTSLFACYGLLWLFAGFETAFFTGLLLTWFVYRLDSRFIAGAALLVLIAIPALFYIGRDQEAQRLASYAFFLIAITVVLQIIDYARESGLQESKVRALHGAELQAQRARIEAPLGRAINRTVPPRSAAPALPGELTLQERLMGVRYAPRKKVRRSVGQVRIV